MLRSWRNYGQRDSNIRAEGAKIHRSNCEAVEAMMTSKYPKIFSVTADDVAGWLNTHPGTKWEHCGLCGGGCGFRGMAISVPN
jgi:hypothetical protein